MQTRPRGANFASSGASNSAIRLISQGIPPHYTSLGCQTFFFLKVNGPISHQLFLWSLSRQRVKRTQSSFNCCTFGSCLQQEMVDGGGSPKHSSRTVLNAEARAVQTLAPDGCSTAQKCLRDAGVTRMPTLGRFVLYLEFRRAQVSGAVFTGRTGNLGPFSGALLETGPPDPWCSVISMRPSVLPDVVDDKQDESVSSELCGEETSSTEERCVRFQRQPIGVWGPQSPGASGGGVTV